MAVEIVTAPEAEQDVADAYAWYESRRAGLGEEFLSCVDACIEAIRRIPEMHAIVYESYRRTLLRRFPYALFYEYAEGVATVYGIFHTSRHPEKWMRRVSSADDER
jgi:plasmid stabilization system protein ParE